MIDVKIDYINFNPKLHKEFPIIRQCKVYQKNNIVNVFVDTNKDIEDVTDDISFDNKGKFYFISYGQWHHVESGKYLPLDDLYSLEDHEYGDYEYVSFVVKLYTNNNWKSCYHENSGSKILISFIPNHMIDFKESDAKIIFKL